MFVPILSKYVKLAIPISSQTMVSLLEADIYQHRQRMQIAEQSRMTLAHLEKVPIDELGFGPEYLITAPERDNLSIFCITPPIVPSVKLDIQAKYRTMVLAAMDPKGKIVGMEGLIFNDYTNSLDVTGKIVVFERGNGVATGIGLTVLHICQNESNRHQKPLEWWGQDINFRDILHHQFDAAYCRDTLSQSALTAERERWQALYGSEGELGFDHVSDDHSVRRFDPNAEEVIYLETADRVVLQTEKQVVGGRVLKFPKVLAVVHGQRDAIRQWKMQKYQDKILPALKRLVA